MERPCALASIGFRRFRRIASVRSLARLGFRNLHGRLVDHHGRLGHQVNRSMARQERYAPALHALHDHTEYGTLDVPFQRGYSFLIHERHLLNRVRPERLRPAGGSVSLKPGGRIHRARSSLVSVSSPVYVTIPPARMQYATTPRVP